ncbi:hypothetical protein QBC42DRAFT_250973 [Cladorrhinum samala]|uniref:Uncharacterized protein n=1 Tax=Cladorrhinum samala TaxID=585594 RepID=A0AAV9HQV6_9PEZI|nr:hypothetical protein QBC42DRAFT_250973 [Cladorrhinum samala]
MDDWEEPHPGQRFHFTSAKAASMCCLKSHLCLNMALHKGNDAATAGRTVLSSQGTAPCFLFKQPRRPRAVKQPRKSMDRHNHGRQTLQLGHESHQRDVIYGSRLLSGPALAEPNMSTTCSAQWIDIEGTSRCLSWVAETVGSSELSESLSTTSLSDRVSVAAGTAHRLDGATGDPALVEKSDSSAEDVDTYNWEAEFEKRVCLGCRRQTSSHKKSMFRRLLNLPPKGMLWECC